MKKNMLRMAVLGGLLMASSAPMVQASSHPLKREFGFRPAVLSDKERNKGFENRRKEKAEARNQEDTKRRLKSVKSKEAYIEEVRTAIDASVGIEESIAHDSKYERLLTSIAISVRLHARFTLQDSQRVRSDIYSAAMTNVDALLSDLKAGFSESAWGPKRNKALKNYIKNLRSSWSKLNPTGWKRFLGIS